MDVYKILSKVGKVTLCLIASIYIQGCVSRAPIATPISTESLAKGQLSVTGGAFPLQAGVGYGVFDEVDLHLSAEHQGSYVLSALVKKSFHEEERKLNYAMFSEVFYSEQGYSSYYSTDEDGLIGEASGELAGLSIGSIMDYKISSKTGFFISPKISYIKYAPVNFNKIEHIDTKVKVELSDTEVIHLQSNFGFTERLRYGVQYSLFFPCYVGGYFSGCKAPMVVFSKSF